MSRRDELMKKTAGIRSVSEIPDLEIPAEEHVPRSGQGSFYRRQKLEERIRELETAVEAVGTVGVKQIRTDQISPNPWQPRRIFDEAEIQKLAGSIAEVGLIQPVIVRCVPNMDTLTPPEESVPNMDTQYQLVAGERRWRAHRSLDIQNIKAVIVDVSDEEMAALALAENFDREDLTAYEIALAIQSAEVAFPNKKSLASALGIGRTDLYRFLTFFQLPDFVVEDLEHQPGLLGRHAAEEIVAMLKKHGERANETFHNIWPRVKSGEVDQGKAAGLIEASVMRGSQTAVQRDIRKLFVGKEQAGSITRDAAKLKIEIKVAALSPEREAELRKFVERMFANDG